MGRKCALTILSVTALCVGAVRFAAVRMGRQPDGSFVVSTGQRVEAGGLSFNGRPIDFALHPTEALFAVLNKNYVFLATTDGVLTGTGVPLGTNAGFRGLVWTPDGTQLFASTEQGHIQALRYRSRTLTLDRRILIQPASANGNPVRSGRIGAQVLDR